MRRISPRYELALPLQYRRKGEASWRTATVINISSTGVIFLAPESLSVGTEIDLSIQLGSPDDVLRAGRLACRAQVVRTETDTEAKWNTVAARFSGYKLERRGEPTTGELAFPIRFRMVRGSLESDR